MSITTNYTNKFSLTQILNIKGLRNFNKPECHTGTSKNRYADCSNFQRQPCIWKKCIDSVLKAVSI